MTHIELRGNKRGLLHIYCPYSCLWQGQEGHSKFFVQYLQNTRQNITDLILDIC